MIGNLLYKLGQTAFGVVGPVHDTLKGSVETPTLNSDNIELLELQESPVMPGTVANTIYYYVGGTLVVGILVGLIACKAWPKKAMVKRRMRRTSRKRQVASKRRQSYPKYKTSRSTYRSNGRDNRRKGYKS